MVKATVNGLEPAVSMLSLRLDHCIPEIMTGPLSVALNFSLAPREVSLAVTVLKGL